MDGLTITLPLEVVRALLAAASPTEKDRAMLDLRRSVAEADDDTTDEWWRDIDPSELPRF